MSRSRSDVVIQSVSESVTYVHVFVGRRWKRIFDPFPSLDVALDWAEKYKKDHPPPDPPPTKMPTALSPSRRPGVA